MRLAAGDARVQVVSDQPEVLRAVRAMFPERIAVDDAPTTAQVVIDGDGDDGYRVSHPEDRRPQPIGWTALVPRLEHLVARQLLAGHTDRVHLHAGGARLGESGVLLLGPSGSGKSTLSVRLLLDGAPILGDDVVLVGEGAFAEPFHRRPKIDADQARRFGIDPEETVLWQPGADECWLDPRDWAGWSAPLAVDLVARVRYVPGAELQAEWLDPSQLLSMMLSAAFPQEQGGMTPENVATVLLETASRSRGLRLTYGQSEDAAAFLRETVDARGHGSE